MMETLVVSELIAVKEFKSFSKSFLSELYWKNNLSIIGKILLQFFLQNFWSFKKAFLKSSFVD